MASRDVFLLGVQGTARHGWLVVRSGEIDCEQRYGMLEIRRSDTDMSGVLVRKVLTLL